MLQKPEQKQPERDTAGTQPKNVYKISVGSSASSLKGYKYNDVQTVGYAINFEYQRHMPCKLYYAASVGIANRGYCDHQVSLKTSVINVVPVDFGYEYSLSRKFAMFAHVGWFIDFSFDDNQKDYVFDPPLSDNDIMDTGIRYGVGFKYGKVSLEVMNHNSFTNRYDAYSSD